jgi:hypothetical protein
MSKSTVRENVEKLLREIPATRSNDKLLMLTYWEDIDGIEIGNRFDFVFRATSPESIRRARQLIQSEDKYLPSEKVVAIRRGRQSGMIQAVRQREVI